jgi:hypothetical protein
VSERINGVIDEPTPEFYEKGSRAVVTLYRIGLTNDWDRSPLFTTNKEKAMNFLIGEIIC